MIRFIAELGSNHLNNIDRFKHAIDMVEGTPVELKAQLFGFDSQYHSNGNVYLDHTVFLEALEYARSKRVVLSASVFDYDSCEFLIKQRPKFIKFAYSQKDSSYLIEDARRAGIEAIVSCDVMSDRLISDSCTKLFCVPRYPVYEQLTFDCLFPRFDGFSDHTLGFRQTEKAIAMGAKIIEKHVKIDASDRACPDDYFSVPLASFITLAERVRQ